MFYENRLGIKKSVISFVDLFCPKTGMEFREPYHSNHVIPHRVVKMAEKHRDVFIYLQCPIVLHFMRSLKGIQTGPSCSKLTTVLVNVSLKFQRLISNICQYFLLKKCVRLLQCKSFSHFFNKNNISVFG